MAKAAKADMYSFRAVDRVFGTVFQPDSAAGAALAAIDATLAAAHAAHLDRRYADAVRGYTDVRSMAYAQLNPGAGGSRRVALDPRLFEPLLSLSVEWMNVLPVSAPVAAVRPRQEIDPALFAQASAFDAVGLRTPERATPVAAAAAADLTLAVTLEESGNGTAATFFRDRATRTAPDLVAKLTPVVAPPGGGPVVPANGLLGNGLLTRRARGLDDELATRLVRASRFAEPIDIRPPRVELPPAVTVERSVGTLIGDRVEVFTWAVGDAPPVARVRAALYADRVTRTDLREVIRFPVVPSDLALSLPHLYFYLIPLGLAESLHALGDHPAAEAEYLRAASYEFLNAAIEAPYVWTRLATLYLDWADSLYRDGDAAAALPLYERILTTDGAEPASALYTTPGLRPGADVARAVLADLAGADTLDVDQAIAAVVVEAHQQLTKISGGLDFWGFWGTTVPIWTFDYLQGVAVNFAQLAVGAERDVINFWDRAGQATLTRQQLVGAAASSAAEVQAADMQTRASQAELNAYQTGVVLATVRAQDAHDNAEEYERQSDLAISYSAASSQVSGGDDGDPAELNRLADRLLSGHSIRGSRGTISAAGQLAGAKANRKYEIDALRRQAVELDLARAQARAETVAAAARADASRAAATVARIRQQNAQQLLTAYDEQFFTADVWQRMGDTMYRLYQRYLAMALRAARLMQQAYNFETDQALRLIRSDYATDEVKGLLGADALLADVQTFTYDLITSTAGKPQPVRQTVSLAERYPLAFEQLRRTGAMDFETRIDDFDALYPGTYAGRIDAVEVEVDGLVPPAGLSGTLTNSGISSYRVPLAAWADPATSGLKHRVQNRETLVLSDWTARQDTLLSGDDRRKLRVFEGAGLVSSWRLAFPPAVNDLDFGALLDVRLTFYYQARFDPDLADKVTAELATRPGFTSRQRAVPLRWLYPDAFFAFQDTGQLRFTLRRADFPANQTAPRLDSVGVLLATDGSVPAGGLHVGLTTPGKPRAVAVTDAAGAVDSFAGLVGDTALGDYVIDLSAADDPVLAPGGTLELGPMVNVVLLFDYSFTPRG